ncbi:alpha/beta hydrolase family protein [Maritalea sp. S77]|uniref:alpha/beta hydrolase family protein n=1 Tax=Maritalea sp. S77 TaxID=3415125 RepID=UPI003C7BA8FF
MMGRRATMGASVVLGLILILVGLVFWVPDAGYATRILRFEHKGKTIFGQISLPHNGEQAPLDCIVFVHGDGEMDRSAFGYFDPYFSKFAEHGWCAFSWDKPGVGDSDGDWLSYSMADRAALIDDAIAALRAAPNLDIDRVGVLGFSQAGWVMPQLDVEAGDIDFIVFVSPAVNWMAQSAYMTALRRRFAPDSDAKVAAEAELEALINDGAGYDAFLALSKRSEVFELDDFSKARWDFVVRNAQADLSEDLARLPNVPILLLAGGRDGQVDANKSVAAFKAILPPEQLQVHLFEDAGHSMVPTKERRPMTGEDGLWLLGKVMLWGSGAFVDGYWATLNGFIAAQFSE